MILSHKRRTFRFCLLFLTLAYKAAASINYEKPLSIQIENLNRWKSSPEALAIQQGLGERIKARPDYPRVAEPYEGAKKWSFLYGKPFLVLEAEPNPDGGFWGVLVFKDYPRVFGLWLYDLSKVGTAWEIRAIEPFNLKIPIPIMDQLADWRVTPFWLQASTTW